MDEAGALVAANVTGELVVRGLERDRRYKTTRKRIAARFAESWFRTSDSGHLDEEGYVFITGRIKELINRGG